MEYSRVIGYECLISNTKEHESQIFVEIFRCVIPYISWPGKRMQKRKEVAGD